MPYWVATAIPRKCLCNEVVSLTNRLAKDTKFLDEHGELGMEQSPHDTMFRDIINEMSAKLLLHYHPEDLKTRLNKNKGKLRSRYENAAMEVYEDGFHAVRDSAIGMFIKVEDYKSLACILNNVGLPTEAKDPRMIAGRNPKFNLGYGRFTTALEHAMVAAFPQIMKGRNALQRGQAFQKLVLSTSGHYLKTDFSRFDSTQHIHLLRTFELGIMRGILPYEEFELFKQYWILKMIKRGTYSHGLKFKLFGCRGSGDMDTGLFNTLINYATAVFFLRSNGFDETKFIVDGDDGVIWVPTKNYVPTWHLFGLDITAEVVSDYHDVTFCSSHFMQINRSGQFMQVTNFLSVCQKIDVLKNKQFAHCAGEYFYSLGYMYSKMYPDFPGYSQLARYLMTLTNRKQYFEPDMIRANNPHHLDYMLDTNTTLDVDYEFLLSEYYLCYDIGSSELAYLIQHLSTANTKLPPCHDKRYRVRNRVTERLSDQVIEYVEKSIDHAILNYSPTIKEYCILFL